MNKLECLYLASPLRLVLNLQKVQSLATKVLPSHFQSLQPKANICEQRGASIRWLHTNGRLVALVVNIRLGWRDKRASLFDPSGMTIDFETWQFGLAWQKKIIAAENFLKTSLLRLFFLIFNILKQFQTLLFKFIEKQEQKLWTRHWQQLQPNTKNLSLSGSKFMK